jgi:hypothetical protein
MSAAPDTGEIATNAHVVRDGASRTVGLKPGTRPLQSPRG